MSCAWRRVTALALVSALAAAGCASTSYQPQLVARGELTLRYHQGYEMYAAGREVAHGPGWRGLAEHVRCVPRARELAEEARAKGRSGAAASIVGATLGVVALGGLYGVFVDENQGRWAFLGGGLGVAVGGLVAAIASRALRNGANGRAVDAMNFYNDSVGSLGATCEDLTYPPPAGPAAAAPAVAPGASGAGPGGAGVP